MNAGIEAARFVLAGGVALFHWNGCLPSAYLAVDLFFVISGFVLGRRYEAALRAGGSLRKYGVGRLIRLYPLYLLGAAAGFASHFVDPLVTDGWSLSLADLAWRAVLIVPVLDAAARPEGVQAFPFDVPAWSLWCEVLANALFGLLCRAPRLAMAAPVAAGLVTLLVAALDASDLSGGGDARTVALGLARIGFGFFAGVLLARLPRVPPSGPLAGAVALLLVLGGLLLVFRLIEPRRGTVPEVLMLLVAGFPAATLCIAACELPGAVARAMVAAGSLSYALYILHWPLFRIARGLGAGPGVWHTLAVLLAVLVAAGLVTRYADRPARHWLHSLRVRRYA